jgi:molybdate transport system ATP-binding protein
VTFSVQAAVAAREFDVALTVGPAETVAIMGPNGAGKSTLLNVIAGLLHADSGRAELDGRVLFDLAAGRGSWTAPHGRGTALLAQEALLFPHLSVLENVAFGPRSAGASKQLARESALRWLSEVDATELQSRRPAELSGGQAQRVAVARALATDPGLLLLDEPMAALDLHAAPLLRRLLKRVLADRRAIIITHDVLDALMLADRVVILENGRISEQGPTREVLQRPKSRFAAGLAGLNLVTGSITAHGLQSGDVQSGGVHSGGLVLYGQHDDLPGPLPFGQPGVAVFPPSAVSVFLTEAHGSPRNSFAVTITDLEPHGDRIRVRAGEGGQLSADVTPEASADLGLAPGMQVYFVVKAGAVAIYPG